jgi:hypothetical protein
MWENMSPELDDFPGSSDSPGSSREGDEGSGSLPKVESQLPLAVQNTFEIDDADGLLIGENQRPYWDKSGKDGDY